MEAAYNNRVRTLRVYIILTLFLGVIAALVLGFFRTAPTHISTPAPSVQAVASPPSAEVKAYLAISSGFQYLVSFTDKGFEPIIVTMQKGETIRFVNNSQHNLWIAATGDSGSIYPGTGKECGQSAFDSCKTLNKGDFWEFTFTKVGTWSYHNNFDLERTGIIIVE